MLLPPANLSFEYSTADSLNMASFYAWTVQYQIFSENPQVSQALKPFYNSYEITLNSWGL